MPALCDLFCLGLVDYSQAWRLQARLAGEIAAGQRPPALLLLEHPHTFTFGSQGRPEHLLWPPDELARRGVQVHWVDRGGDVTYHGPGQLVGYPLLPLGPALQPAAGNSGRLPQADYTGYLRRLEQALIQALACLGVSAFARPGLTGVWAALPQGSQPGKLASIGVKVDAQGVSRHGFALNIAPQMEYWQGIIACGLEDEAPTSLAALHPPPPAMEAVISQVVQAFAQVFHLRLVPRAPGDLITNWSPPV